MATNGAQRTPWYASIVTRITLVFAALLLGLLVVMGWVSWRASREELISQAHHAMDHTLEVAVNRMLTAARSMQENLDVLATSPAMLDWCASLASDDARQDMAREVVAAFIDPVMRSRPRFAQMRLIGADSAGTEVIRFDRVGREVYRVPDAYLQSKRERYYYTRTMAAGPGSRLSFPMDLNREHRGLERPFVPTLRMTAPLFTPDGARAGIVVINSDMRALFAELLAMADSGRALVLARGDGEVLLHPDTALTFRFELGGSSRLDEVLPRSGEEVSGEPMLVGHRSFTLGPSGDPYMLAITQPMGGLLGTLREKRNELILLFSGIGAGAIGLIALLALGLRRQLNAITGSMERYAVGSHQDLPIGRTDEFGRMAQGLRTMQHRIDERVKELEAARAAAEASDKQRRELLANMSHEVRTPLNAIIGMSDGVAPERLSPQDRDRIAIVRRSAERLKGLVDDLLTHARIGEGKLVVRLGPVDVATLVSDVVQAHEPQAKAKGLLVHTEHEGLPSALLTDALRLHQVVDNLVGNAIRFTGQGYVRIQAEMSGQETLMLRVSDTGPGIPATERERVFERFERAMASEQEHGAGLGLAITKRVVDLLGGTITLDSEMGHGSCFTVRLPVRAVEPSLPGQEPVADTTGSRVLYVEDVATNRMLLQEWAERWGWRMTVVERAEDALMRCGTERWDLLLVDLQLGSGMDGITLVQHLRANGLNRYAPMIALTAHASDGEDTELLIAGLNDRVTKPVDKDLLHRTVAFWCGLDGTMDGGPDLRSLAAQYDDDMAKLRPVHAQYRAEFVQRRLALRTAMSTGDEKALSGIRHALRPHWELLGLHGPLAVLEGLTVLSAGSEMAALEQAFRLCDRAFLAALRGPVRAA